MDKLEEKYPVPEHAAKEYEEAVALIGEMEMEAAAEILERLAELEPEHPRIAATLGLVYFRLKELKKAEGILLKLLERGLSFAEVHSHLSAVYSWSGQMEEAAKHAEIALRLNPKSPEVWTASGLCHAFDGDYEGALDYFLAAYSMDSEFLVAAYNAACTYAVLGKPERALCYLEKALGSKYFIVNAWNDPDFDSIRDTADFKTLVSSAEKRFHKTENSVPN
ncbi:MAG: tetratricopeptide repeat protein [Candidatus Coatesbacteria bacterium]|nr:MAG: tetratricopeptide repeat protein [Candidatus Coatesbacteria bacterium]